MPPTVSALRAASSVVEHLAFNQRVAGSIPARPTKFPSLASHHQRVETPPGLSEAGLEDVGALADAQPQVVLVAER